MNSYMFYDSVETVAKYGMLHPPSPTHTHTHTPYLLFLSVISFFQLLVTHAVEIRISTYR